MKIYHFIMEPYDKNYVGIPTLIVEILSPSNEAHDLVTKMNLYQRFGAK